MSSFTLKNNEHKCSICGNKTQLIVPNIFRINTAHSETPVNQILERLLCKTPTEFTQQFQNNETCACQDCLIKIDEYDLAYTNAERIENELINLILKSNDRKQQSNISVIFKHEPSEDSNDDFFKNFIEQDTTDIDDNMDDSYYEMKSNIAFVAKCEVCNIEFGSIEELNEHEHIYETPKSSDCIGSEILISEINGQKTLKLSGSIKTSVVEECAVCGEHFYSKTEYKEHMRDHKRNKYKCQHCEKSFISEIHLDIHQAIHEGRSELECPHCLKVLSSKGAMVKHRRIHLQEYKYQCERCGKQFLHDTSFRMHMYAHDDTRKVSCKVCHRQFRCTPHLNRHMRIHTGEKPYSCPSCGRLFAQRYNMMMHYKSHDPNGGDFKCTICEKSFTSRKRLNEHLKLEHNTILEMSENKVDRPRRIPVFGDTIECEDYSKINTEEDI